MSTSALLFSFRGRINRLPYWLANFATVIAVGLIFVLFGGAMSAGDDTAIGALAVLVLVLYVPMIWVGLALAAKRLHDRSKSAWWLLVFYVLPGVLNAAGSVWIAFTFAGLSISIWGLVEIGFLRGTTGANDYGPDPLMSAPQLVRAPAPAFHES